MQELRACADAAGLSHELSVLLFKAERNAEAEVRAEAAGNIRPLTVGNVSRRTDVAVRAMDDAIVAAINAAKNAGVPQGLIVGLLHSYAHDQTAALVNGA
jgi:hypothetical protein